MSILPTQLDPATGRIVVDVAASTSLGGGAESDRPLDLREVDLRGALLVGADLRDARMARCSLVLADLRGAALRGVDLSGADLSLADLRGADLRAADLSGADLSGADLRDARFDGADLTDAELAFAQTDGARELPDEWNTADRANGRIVGPLGAAGDPEPALRAYQRGRRAHADGRLGEAEARYLEALAWEANSDAARYTLACTSLERGDAATAACWLDDAVRCNPAADRARFEGAVLALARGDIEHAEELLHGTPQGQLQARVSAEKALAVLAGSAQLQQRHDEVSAILSAAVGPDAPAVKWTHRRRRQAQRVDRGGTIARLGDPDWIAAERADLKTLTAGGDQPAFVWHGAIARSITIGAMELAARAEQRLTRQAPEHRLWGLQLRHLDLTEQAFEALVRTRSDAVGACHAVQWVAIGAHGPTARLQCDGGVFYAKRYIGATRPPASVAFTHRVIRAMHAGGIAAPAPLADAQGDDVLVFSSDLLALYPDCGGTSIADDDIDVEEARDVGTLLARIHVVGQSVPSSERPAGGLRIGTRLLRHPHADRAFEQLVVGHRDVAIALENHAWTTRVLSLIRATSRRLLDVLPRCPTTVVHGDFGPGNVLLREGQPPAVIDWDLADVDLAAWDLARTIDRIAIRWPDRLGAPAEIRTNIVSALLDGYQSVRPLLSSERKAIPVLAAASRLDLDASVLAMCAALEPEIIDPVMTRCLVRLSRAAAGCPELAVLMASP